MYGLAKVALESPTGGAAYLLGERGIRIDAVELGALWTAAVADNLPEEAREPRRKMSALQTEGDCFDAASAGPVPRLRSGAGIRARCSRSTVAGGPACPTRA